MTYSKAIGHLLHQERTATTFSSVVTDVCRCNECGAVVPESSQDLHDDWHYRVEMRSDIED